MKKNTLRRILVLLPFIASVIIYGCKKDELPAVETPGLNNNDLTTRAKSSVSGFVTDENDLRVTGATVTAGSITTTTDQYGYFTISNADMIKNAAFVTITKAGYFNAVKTWVISENNPAFFRIKLIPKTTAGTVSGTAGGTVTITGGVKIVFPAAAFVNASTGAAYSGTVTVKGQWLNPSAADLGNTMPGDLRGKDASGNVKKLATYGMSAVELTGSGGELLQIAPGKKATLTMPIPSSLQSSAPATIPLWYFDESLGLWKEEGSATKSGTEYSGDVSHFSYWNCDVPSNFVQFNITVNDAGGNPVQNALVKVTVASTGTYGTGYTNVNGYSSGTIPAGTNFILEIYAGQGCSTVLYSQNFSTGSVNISLGTVTLNSNRTVRITGNLTDCNTAAVTNGFLTIVYDNRFMIVNADTAGHYGITIPVCAGNNVNTVLTAYTTTAQSQPTSNVFQSGTTNTVNLQLCTSAASPEYFNYTYSNNIAYAYNGNIDSVYLVNDIPGTFNYKLRGVKMPGSVFASTLYIISSSAPAVGQTKPLGTLTDASTPATFTFLGNVTFTEVGAVGTGFLAGSFSGTVTPAPGGAPIAFTGTFRAKRPI